MTVFPGFGGQAFIADVMAKVDAVRGGASTAAVWPSTSRSTAASTRRRPRVAAAAGANVFVAGSAIFGHDAPWEAVDGIRAGRGERRVKAHCQGLQGRPVGSSRMDPSEQPVERRGRPGRPGLHGPGRRARRRGPTAPPNPWVGAVMVPAGDDRGRGLRGDDPPPGGDHAEVVALRRAAGAGLAAGATLYMHPRAVLPPRSHPALRRRHRRGGRRPGRRRHRRPRRAGSGPGRRGACGRPASRWRPGWRPTRWPSSWPPT